jgi:hypothetical protein
MILVVLSFEEGLFYHFKVNIIGINFGLFSGWFFIFNNYIALSVMLFGCAARLLTRWLSTFENSQNEADGQKNQ